MWRITWRATIAGMLVALITAVRPVYAEGERVILCSFYPVYIMVKNVAAGVPGVRVVNMAKVQTGCLHDYQLTPRDMQMIMRAWVFVVNGAGMESFLEKALAQRPDLRIIDASAGIELIRREMSGVVRFTSESHTREHDPRHRGHTAEEHHAHHNMLEYNPHVFVSVSGAMAQVKNIADGLAALDTVYASTYRRNAEAYRGKLMALRERMRAALRDLPSRTIVTFHEAFPYFAKEFGLEIAAVIEREPGVEPSAGELAEIVRIVRGCKVKALFAEPQYPSRAAQAIARETGLRVYTLDPAVTGPDHPDAYVRIMEANLAVLLEALK